jgi:hypothetical protein
MKRIRIQKPRTLRRRNKVLLGLTRGTRCTCFRRIGPAGSAAPATALTAGLRWSCPPATPSPRATECAQTCWARCPSLAARASSPITAGRCTPISGMPALDMPPGRVSTTTAATGTSCARPDRSSAASSTGWPASGARASAVCWGLQSRWDSIITACALLTAVAVAALPPAPLRTDSRMRHPQIDTEEAKLHQTPSGAGLR